MKCPTDDSTLVMSERNGVEIDYCPQCRGVWLDRGELDKIIDRAQPPAVTEVHGQRDSYGQRDGYGQRDARDQHDRYGQRPYTKKRDNWLSELFD